MVVYDGGHLHQSEMHPQFSFTFRLSSGAEVDLCVLLIYCANETRIMGHDVFLSRHKDPITRIVA